MSYVTKCAFLWALIACPSSCYGIHSSAGPALRDLKRDPAELDIVSVSAHGQASHNLKTEDHEVHKKPARNYYFKVHPLQANDKASLAQADVSEDEEMANMLEDTVGSGVGWEESLTGGCDQNETALHERTTVLGRGSLSNLQYHNVACDKPGGLLSQFRLTSGGTANDMKVLFKCCQYADALGTCVSKSAPEAQTVTGDGSILNLDDTSRGDGESLAVSCGLSEGVQTGLRSWKLRDDSTGTALAFDYECCPLDVGGKKSFSDGCEDNRKTPESPEDSSIQALYRHDVTCSWGFVLTKWSMVQQASLGFQLQFSCCPIGTPIVLAQTEKTCRWVGDPHFVYTFDNGRHDITKADTGFYWVVKSDYIQIQGYYQGASNGAAMRTRGTVIAGKFLLGHKLIIKHDVNHLKSPAQSKSYRQGSTPTSVCWDGQCETTDNGVSKFLDNAVSVTKSSRTVNVVLPLGVRLTVKHHSYWSDQTLSLKKPVGEWGGQCGNNDGNSGNDKDIRHSGGNLGENDEWKITNDAENMFLNDFHGAGVKSAAESKECPVAARTAAEAICEKQNKDLTPVETKAQFKAICILDLCNTEGFQEQLALAAGDAEAGADAKMDVDFGMPRAYSVAETTCPEGHMAATPRSPSELLAVMEAISAYTGTNSDHDLFFVGIEKSESTAEWKWNNNNDMTAVCDEEATFWAKGEPTAGQSKACVNKLDGKVHSCASDGGHPVACEEDRMYGTLAMAGPITARTACGPGKQLAMPKTQRERTRMDGVIQHEAGLMFLGATFVGPALTGKWEWDDGTPFCTGHKERVDWAQTDGTVTGTAQYFLCVIPQTGKWVPCSGFSKRGVVCETKHAEAACPLSQQTMSDLKMTTPPGKRTRYKDRCYYMTPKETSCDKFCLSEVRPSEIMGCDADGLKAASESKLACHMIVRGLGIHVDYTENTVKRQITAGEAFGCTYFENQQTAGVNVIGPPSMPEFVAPGCDTTPTVGDSFTHRVCSCKKVDSSPFPTNHAVEEGDIVTTFGKGLTSSGLSEGSATQGQTSITFSKDAAQTANGNGLMETAQEDIVLKFVADPQQQVITRSYHYNGQWHDSVASNKWPFDNQSPDTVWSVSLASTSSKWEVSIGGSRMPDLDFPKDISLASPKGVELSGVVDGVVTLTHRPVYTGDPVSYTSENEPKKLPDHITGGLITWYFQLFMTAIDGRRCIRCETADFIHGSHILMEDGKLLLAIVGNQPYIQSFDYEFKVNTPYDVMLHYNKDERTGVAELYISNQRVEVAHYTIAMEMDSDAAYLGAFNQDEYVLDGKISDFVIKKEPLTMRPEQDRCVKTEALDCPGPQFKFKDEAYDILCAGSICYDDTDKGTCCDEMPKCNPGKTCPQAMVYKPDASNSFCTDANCTSVGSTTACCDQTESCADITCPADHLHHLNASAMFCHAKACTAVDHAKCCVHKATCDSHTCTGSLLLRERAFEKVCAGRDCGAAGDDATCCAAPGTCGLYHCPANMALKANPDSNKCADPDCKQTAYHECCDPAETCNLHTCSTDDVVLVANAESYNCRGLKCEAKDDGRCCEARAKCDEFAPQCNAQTQDKCCNSDSVLIASAASTMCKSKECAQADDHSTCCAARGTCNLFECPPDWRLKPTASSILCADVQCQDTDFKTCCGEDAPCSSLDCTSVGEIQKLVPHGAIQRCDGFNCSITSPDRQMCCTDKSQCPTHSCPAHQTMRQNSHAKFCATRDCSSADDELCCVDKEKCTGFKCEIGSVHKHNAITLLCAGESCNDETQNYDERWLADQDQCCTKFASCDTYHCPLGFNHIISPERTLCAGYECDASDRGTCCVGADTCNNYDCPQTLAGEKYTIRASAATLFCGRPTCDVEDIHTCCWRGGFCTSMVCSNTGGVHLPGAHDIPCDDRECVSTPNEKCCATTSMCNSFACPERFVPKLQAAVLPCAGLICDHTDRTECCDAAMSCSQHECAAGSTLRAEHADLVCHDRYCTGADHEICCAPKGHCLTFPCGEGFKHIQSEDLLCADENCTDTAISHCCAAEQKCNTYTCPENFIHRDSAETLECVETTGCTAVDRDKCCQPTQTCEGYSCPGSLVLKQNAGRLECQGTTCTEDERNQCCTTEGTCDSMTCTLGYQHRHNAHELFCADTACKETDYHQCCVAEGHCNTYTCPELYVHKINSTYCADWTCREVDTEACCDLRAECNEEVCPSADVLRFDADDGHHICVNKTCLPQDFSTCCTQKGICSSRTCPQGYQHKVNAINISCHDDNCTAQGIDHCCAPEDLCHTYHCPAEYLHKANFETISCHGFKCTDHDRDTCCDHQAWCNTYQCNTGGALYVARSDVESILCTKAECVDGDRDTCCEPRGHCSKMVCPSSHLPHPDSANRYCADMRCLEEAPDACCKVKEKCQDGLTCPDKHSFRIHANGSTDPFYCSGFACVASGVDEDLCCEPNAPCSDYPLPTGYVMKHNVAELVCAGAKCIDGDLHHCTAEVGMCSNFKCLGSTSIRHDARHIPCSDEDCLQTAVDVCCATKGSCDSHHCPVDFVHVASAGDLSCKNDTCAAVDDGTCCQQAKTCDTWRCQHETVHRDNAGTMFCAQGKETQSCTEADQHTCCQQAGMCSAFPCPAGELHLHNSFEIPCADTACSESSYTACCVNEKSCLAYTCPTNHVQKQGSLHLHCIDKVCTDFDKHFCCDETTSCQKMACPTDYQWKWNYLKLRCATLTCEADDIEDRDQCCEYGGASGEAPTESEEEGEDTTEAPKETVKGAEGNDEESMEAGARRGSIGGALSFLGHLELGVLLLGGFVALVPSSICGLQE